MKEGKGEVGLFILHHLTPVLLPYICRDVGSLSWVCPLIYSLSIKFFFSSISTIGFIPFSSDLRKNLLFWLGVSLLLLEDIFLGNSQHSSGRKSWILSISQKGTSLNVILIGLVCHQQQHSLPRNHRKEEKMNHRWRSVFRLSRFKKPVSDIPIWRRKRRKQEKAVFLLFNI